MVCVQLHSGLVDNLSCWISLWILIEPLIFVCCSFAAMMCKWALAVLQVEVVWFYICDLTSKFDLWAPKNQKLLLIFVPPIYIYQSLKKWQAFGNCWSDYKEKQIWDRNLGETYFNHQIHSIQCHIIWSGYFMGYIFVNEQLSSRSRKNGNLDSSQIWGL